MEKTLTLAEYTRDWVSTLEAKTAFTVRDIRRSYRSYIWLKEGKRVSPYDDSFSRVLRRLRAEGFPLSYIDKTKAIWWKNSEPPKSREEQKSLVIKYNAKSLY